MAKKLNTEKTYTETYVTKVKPPSVPSYRTGEVFSSGGKVTQIKPDQSGFADFLKGVACVIGFIALLGGAVAIGYVTAGDTGANFFGIIFAILFLGWLGNGI